MNTPRSHRYNTRHGYPVLRATHFFIGSGGRPKILRDRSARKTQEKEVSLELLLLFVFLNTFCWNSCLKWCSFCSLMLILIIYTSWDKIGGAKRDAYHLYGPVPVALLDQAKLGWYLTCKALDQIALRLHAPLVCWG
jgi:hypothetical protein